MGKKTKGINTVHRQVMLIRLNRIRSSICTLGNYKQVIGKQTYVAQFGVLPVHVTVQLTKCCVMHTHDKLVT